MPTAAMPTTLPPLPGVRRVRDLPRRAFVAQIMGLPFSVHVRGPRAHSPAVARAVDAAFERLRRDDAVFSPYRPQSQVSRIQRGELDLRDALPQVREAARLCVEAEARTEGAFSAWRGSERIFDPTGLVKGWAAEQAFAGLADEIALVGAHDLLMSAGGDVVVACERVDTPDWVVGVEDPRDRTRLVATVRLRCGAVATSGSAARGAHIVHPATCGAASSLLSATVIGPSLLWADIYATAAFVRGPGAGRWVASLPSHTAYLVEA